MPPAPSTKASLIPWVFDDLPIRYPNPATILQSYITIMKRLVLTSLATISVLFLVNCESDRPRRDRDHAEHHGSTTTTTEETRINHPYGGPSTSTTETTTRSY